MSELKIGDIVARKSYNCDVFFKIMDIEDIRGEKIITLRGISYRIEADAPESDLIIQSDKNVEEYRSRCSRIAQRSAGDSRKQKMNIHTSRYRGYPKKGYYRDASKEEPEKIKRPGKILHLDGDKSYLENCLKEYKKLGLDAVGQYVPEKDQPGSVEQLLMEHRPDILVLTGHDGFIKGQDSFTDLKAYRTSKYFIEAVKAARRVCNDMDSLVIFAGACQSLYNEIIKAGANFASAPFRDLIHALDPVRVCQKVAFTGIDRVLSAEEVIDSTITGKSGIGGIQTRGKYREGYPAEPYQ